MEEDGQKGREGHPTPTAASQATLSLQLSRFTLLPESGEPKSPHGFFAQITGGGHVSGGNSSLYSLP